MSIHHETIVAKLADEGGGSGRFDILEENGSFLIFNGHSGMYEHTAHPTLDAAVAEAQRLADLYDQKAKDVQIKL